MKTYILQRRTFENGVLSKTPGKLCLLYDATFYIFEIIKSSHRGMKQLKLNTNFLG